MSKTYRATCALDDVTLQFNPGVTVLLGRNGAGKSTLSAILAGAEVPSVGHLIRGEQSVVGKRPHRDHLRRTGWLPQSFAAPHWMSVERFVHYAAWLKEVNRRVAPQRVATALQATDLTAYRKRPLGQLSGGMLRRVGIAQAIVHEPDVLVLDEPTAGLDPEQRHRFHSLVRSLSSDRTIIFSTHLIEDAVALAQTVVIIEDGRIKYNGPGKQLEAKGTGEDRAERLRSAFIQAISFDA